MHRFWVVVYVAAGLMLSAWAVNADRTGWASASTVARQVVPRSIRDNPGAYRPIYSGSFRQFTGK